MSITVTVTPPSVVPAITSGATVQVVAGAGGPSRTTIGAALRLSVANIDDPSTELAALGDNTWPAGTIAICTQDVAGANAYRVYILDLASSTAQSTPNRIDRAAGGQWILEGGKGVAGSFTVETTLAVGGAATVGGTLGVTGAATFASTLSAGAATLSSATITGAATVGTTFGVTGAASLSSTLGVAGVATFTAGTASSSSTTGAVVVSGTGGVGVGGAINAGGAIGSASTITGTQLVSTVATGTAPLTVTSTTVVTNLNASLLLGGTWASPGSIGSTTPGTGAFTTLSASGVASLTNTTAATAVGTAGAVAAGGVSIAKGLVMTGPTNAGSGTAGIGIGVAPDGKQMLLMSCDTGASGGNCATKFIDTNASGNSWLLGVSVSATNGNFQIYDASANALRFQVAKTSGDVSIASTTASSSTTTGSVVIAGGIGAAGDYYGRRGNFGGGSNVSAAVLGISGFSGVTGTVAAGLQILATAPSTATLQVVGAQFGITSAASTAHGSILGFFCPSIGLGSGGTITRAVGALVDPQSSGTNNCGLLISSTNPPTFTGNWAIRSESGNASLLSGDLQITRSIAGAGGMAISNADAGVGSYSYFSVKNDTTNSAIFQSYASGYTGAEMGVTAANYVGFLCFGASNNGMLIGSSGVAKPVIFGVNSAEIMRLRSDGTGLDLATGKVLKVAGTQVVAARDTGWTAMTGTPDKATAYATSTVTLAQLAGRVAQLQAVLTTHGLIGT